MAQRVNLGQTGLPVRIKTFVAKTAAILGRRNPLAIDYESQLADVTPDDNNNLPNSGMLYIGGAGNVKVTGIKGGTVTLVGVPAGTWLNFIRVNKVFAIGTTATNIVVAH